MKVKFCILLSLTMIMTSLVGGGGEEAPSNTIFSKDTPRESQAPSQETVARTIHQEGTELKKEIKRNNCARLLGILTCGISCLCYRLRR